MRCDGFRDEEGGVKIGEVRTKRRTCLPRREMLVLLSLS